MAGLSLMAIASCNLGQAKLQPASLPLLLLQQRIGRVVLFTIRGPPSQAPVPMFQFARDSRVQDALKAGNLDFDARVPIPISVFPSTYRSDATSVETTTTKVEGEVNLGATASSRVGREDTRFSGKEEVDITVNQIPQRRDDRADFRVFEEKSTRVNEGDRFYSQQTQYQQGPQVDITRTRTEQDRIYQTQAQGPTTHIDITRDGYRPSSAPAETRDVHVDIHRERYQRTQQPAEHQDVNVDVQINRGPFYRNTEVSYQPAQVRDTVLETQLDITERDYRRRVNPTYDIEYERRRPVNQTTEVTVEREITTDKPIKNKVDMGYYDDQGQYHSFRRGVQRAVDNIVHPFSHHHHEGGAGQVDENVRVTSTTRENVRFVEPRGASAGGNTVTIPCHFIRVGDLLILQGRPCQVIRISCSAQTGQYRYLGVDLFTKQLQEESSFVSNPEPSVVVQSMVGPVYKQYRILDLREDGAAVCMTETGDVKQGLPIVDQGNLYGKIDRAFADGRGSVRALVINDGGRELIVDYKVIHGSRL